jgi:serine/threonine protein phosphatase PrpC
MNRPENSPSEMPKEADQPDEFKTARLSTPEAMRPPEKKERVETRRFTIASGSLASRFHPERNEDAVVGDKTRLMAENGFPPELKTSDPDADKEAVRRAAGQEAEAADRLAAANCGVVLDGLSGSEHPTGSGYVASRLAAGEIAARLAELADLPPGTPAQDSARLMGLALAAANDCVAEYTAARPDLKDLAGTTVAAARATTGPDGRTEVAYAYAGNTRLYHWRTATRKLIEVSIDDTLAGDALRATEDPEATPPMTSPTTSAFISREEYNLVNSTVPTARLPRELQELREKNDSFSSASKVLGLGAGSFRPHIGVLKAEVGDKVVILTDGAYGNLNYKDIAYALSRADAARELVRLAAGSGGPHDDATALVIDLKATA